MIFQFSIPTSATSGGLSYNDIMYAEMSVIVVDVSPALETPLKNANELDLSFPNVFDLLFCLVLFSFIDSFSNRDARLVSLPWSPSYSISHYHLTTSMLLMGTV